MSSFNMFKWKKTYICIFLKCEPVFVIFFTVHIYHFLINF